MTAPSDPAVAQIDSYVLHLRRHVEALADAPCGRDEHERARDRWSHWFAVQRNRSCRWERGVGVRSGPAERRAGVPLTGIGGTALTSETGTKSGAATADQTRANP